MDAALLQSPNFDSEGKSTVIGVIRYTVTSCKSSKVSVGPVMRVTKEEWEAIPEEKKEELKYQLLLNNKEKLKEIFNRYVNGQLHAETSLDKLGEDEKIKTKLKRIEMINKFVKKLDNSRFDFHSLIPSRP